MDGWMDGWMDAVGLACHRDNVGHNPYPPTYTHLLGRHAVVVEHVASQRAQHDDRDHARQQKHDQQRVDDGEPVHLSPTHQP